MVSIKDIAEQCHVSVATVSKALNNHSDVSASTKKNVCDTAKALGYFPNSQARALKTNKTFNIGILFEDRAGCGLTHNFFSAVLNSFKLEIEKCGYDVTFISSGVGANSMDCYEHCLYRNVDGVMIACVDFYAKDIVKLINSDIPCVMIDFACDKKCSVSSDNVIGMKRIVEYVHRQGHEKIAYIYGDSSQVTNVRLNSYMDTMKKLNLNINLNYIKQGKYHDPSSVEHITAELLNLFEPPTCIILPDDFSSIGAINAIEAAGLTIPDDISIVGYDGIILSEIMKPRLTTIKQNTDVIGNEAAKLLLKSVRGETIDKNEANIIVCGDFVEGQTVKNLNA